MFCLILEKIYMETNSKNKSRRKCWIIGGLLAGFVGIVWLTPLKAFLLLGFIFLRQPFVSMENHRKENAILELLNYASQADDIKIYAFSSSSEFDYYVQTPQGKDFVFRNGQLEEFYLLNDIPMGDYEITYRDGILGADYYFGVESSDRVKIRFDITEIDRETYEVRIEDIELSSETPSDE